MVLYFIFLALGMIALTVFVVLKCKGYSLKVAFAKSVASLLFVLTALASTSLANSDSEHYRFFYFVVAGLILGMLGDIWLDLKHVYKEDDSTFLYFGFASFMIGHIVYISGLVICFMDRERPLYVIIPAVAAILCGLLFTSLDKLMHLNYGKHKLVATIYCMILLCMMFEAVSLSIMTNFANMTLVLMAVGGLLFLISDLILSGTYFGEGKERRIDLAANSITYYFAQFMIASSLIFII